MFELLHRFHSFGNGAQAELLRQGDDRADSGHMVGSAVQPRDKGTINLQGIQRQAVQVCKRGLTGAEIVDGDRDAQAPENSEAFRRGLRVRDDPCFRDLQTEESRIAATGGQGGSPGIGEVGAAELNNRVRGRPWFCHSAICLQAW